MVYFYLCGLLFIGIILRNNLHRKIDLLSSDVSKLRDELRALKINRLTSSDSLAVQQTNLAENLNSPLQKLTVVTEPVPPIAEPVVVPIKDEVKAFGNFTTISYTKLDFEENPNRDSEENPVRESEVKPKLEFVAQPRKRLRDSAFWKNLESYFAGNVTGILGTIAVVLGVIFLGVYAAIQLDPLGRFGVVCMFSAGLYAAYFFLSKKSFWKNISLWIRSASGVIFLIGCIGSVGLDSMKWINDPIMGLGLLMIGLTVNLALGFLNGGQVFASIHVLFSLLALSVIPVNETTFSIAALVAFIGIVIAFKDRQWDKHIIATILGFTALHFYWLYTFTTAQQEFPVQPFKAMALCLIVGAAGIISHYRKTYSGASESKTPFLAHVITWATLGLNLYAHSKGSIYSTLFLAISVVISFAMSMKAQKLSIPWLVICDRLASLLLALMAVISLKKFGLTGYEISAIATAVTAIYLRIVSQTFERTIFKVSNVVLLLAYAVLSGYTLVLIGGSETVPLSSLFMLLGSFLVLGLVFSFIQKKATENQQGLTFNFNNQNHSATGIEIPLALHGFFSLLLAMRVNGGDWFFMVPVVIITFNLILREKLKSLLLDFATLVGLGLSLIISLALIWGGSISSAANAVLASGMIFVGVVSYKLSWFEHFKQRLTWPSVGIIWMILSAACFAFTKNISPALTGICWLLISLVSGEIKDSKIFSSGRGSHDRTDVFMGLVGVASLFAFIIRFFLVDISNEVLAFGMVRIRLFSEVFSLGTLFYWLSLSKPSSSLSFKEDSELFLELLIVIAGVFISLEINNYLHPVLWGIASFACYFIGKRSQRFDRLVLYSYCFYLGSLFQIAFISTTIVTPSALLLDQPWVMGLISIFISTAFMIFAHKDRQSFKALQLHLPKAVKGLSIFKSFIEKLELKILLYPLLIALGFFLFWGFDKTVLSLLWVVECFALFLISIFMREPQFRIVSMIGIGVIFMRIVFYDLTGRDFFIKAVVFISVGLILIAMNTIYNKYKYRYESK